MLDQVLDAFEIKPARLVGTLRNKILSETNLLLTNKETYLAMSNAQNPYGDGKAAFRIIDVLSEGLRNEVSFL